MCVSALGPACLVAIPRYIKANPHAYELGGEGHAKIKEIVDSLSHKELQVFANLGGAAKSFGSMSKEAWQVRCDALGH